MKQEDIEKIKANPELVVRYMAGKRLVNFARYMMPNMAITNFHRVYYEVLDRFAHKKIRRLIVSVPPQTGKSQGSSRFLPSFLLGLNPDLKIVIGSYNADQAKSFNQDVQRIIKDEKYKAVFPDTFLNDGRQRVDNIYRCNSEVTEPVGHSGFLRAVGRNGALTGKSADILILDDVYKDFTEANSPLIREQAWKWYTTVVRTRLHNDSQEIIVFTRWHEDDLIGRLEKSGEKIIRVEKWSDIDNVPRDAYVQLNFPALKVGPPTELDPRSPMEALWEEKHSKESLMAQRALDPIEFECLYQGDPGSAEGRLYGEFKTYTEKSEYGTFVRRGCYVDTADKGTDYLCSICYDIYLSPNTIFNEKTRRFEPILFALVTDVLYTQDPTEVTEVMVPQQINLNGSQLVWIESNNGGGQFARKVERKVRAVVKSFFTSANKETRIISNSSSVMQSIVFPYGWESKWEKVYQHLTRFLRTFSANASDDIEDVLTGIVEKEISPLNARGYRNNRRGIKRAN